MAVFEKRDQNQAANQPTPPPPPARPRLDAPETRPMGPTTTATSTIGESIIIKGDVSGSEDISVSGTVEGSISLPSNHVIVNSTGRVSADIKAKTIEVSGIVEGDLKGGDVVKINASGKMKGNIVAPRIVLQDGAKFKGMIDMEVSGGQSQPKAPSASKSGSSATTPAPSGTETATEKATKAN